MNSIVAAKGAIVYFWFNLVELRHCILAMAISVTLILILTCIIIIIIDPITVHIPDY